MPRTISPDSYGFLLNDLARLIRSTFDRRVAESGIGVTAAEARVLVHIARADGARQNAIAERMGIEAMTLSGFIDRLEARGLVARQTDTNDRRAKLVRLTEEADEALDRIGELSAGIRDEAMRGIAPADWDLMLAVIKTARTNLLETRAGGCTRGRDTA